MTRDRALPAGRGLWYVLVAATAWGTGGAVAAVLYATSGLGPVAVSFWRFVGGAALLALARMTLARRRRLSRPSGPSRPSGLRWGSGDWRLLVVTGCGMAVYQTAYFAAIGLAGLAVATVVTLGAGPVLIAVGTRLTGIDRLGPAGAMSVVVALIGLVLLVGDDASGGTRGGAARLAGVGVALVSATGYAAVTLLTRRSSGRGGPDGYDTALAGFAVGAVVLAPFAAYEGLLPSGGAPAVTLGLFAYLGVVPTALAYGLFFAGLSTVRATTASVVVLVEPVTATVVAVGLLGERLSPRALAGAAVLLATVLMLVLAEAGTLRRDRTAA
jgi:DME family drug/metabolite transporter